MTHTLDIRDLGKTYAARSVLSGISFRINPGERALLLGPSGSGKSTLLNCLCGLQRPDAGEVMLGGDVLASPGGMAAADSLRRRHFGIVFQTLRLVSAPSRK